MSYEDLLKILKTLDEEQLQQTALVYDSDREEYIPIQEFCEYTFEPDVVDTGHLVLKIGEDSRYVATESDS